MKKSEINFKPRFIDESVVISIAKRHMENDLNRLNQWIRRIQTHNVSVAEPYLTAMTWGGRNSGEICFMSMRPINAGMLLVRRCRLYRTNCVNWHRWREREIEKAIESTPDTQLNWVIRYVHWMKDFTNKYIRSSVWLLVNAALCRHCVVCNVLLYVVYISISTHVKATEKKSFSKRQQRKSFSFSEQFSDLPNQISGDWR